MLSSQLAQTIETGDTPDTGEAAARGEAHVTVSTRFGTIEIDAANVITLSRPLYGFAKLTRFALLDIPGTDHSTFKLFQALDDPAAGFIVLPMSRQAGVIAAEDLAQAFTDCGIDAESGAVLLLVTFHQKDENGQTRMTANLRAPVLLDVDRRSARQHIFVNADYPMRLPLELGAE